MNKLTDNQMKTVQKLIAVFAAAMTIILCILPMDDFPIWNGEDPGHRNQYELMAEALLDGRIDIVYGDEDQLASLANPYDPEEREASGVTFHWDHAYYDGHYYMYFGIVPVLLVFLPYRVITGTALTTFRATQLFAAAIIAGMFSLLWLLRKCFFNKMNFGPYLALSTAFSVMSVWYAAAEPALYCTAITAAIALEIWSIFFFVWAVYLERRENRQILLAGVGALLGALVFGCRPPIALANIAVIPLLIVFLKEHTVTPKLIGKLVLAAMPYLLVAAGLMMYNYARFDDPFEFGQAYQLTVADQTNFSFSMDGDQLLRILLGTLGNFLIYEGMSEAFPFQQANGVFLNFPILFICAFFIFSPVRKKAAGMKIKPLVSGLLISAIVITAMDILWTPFMLERYRMDVYFLMGISAFLMYAMEYEESGKKKRMAAWIYALSAASIVSSFLLYVGVVGFYHPERVLEIAQMLGF